MTIDGLGKKPVVVQHRETNHRDSISFGDETNGRKVDLTPHICNADYDESFGGGGAVQWLRPGRIR